MLTRVLVRLMNLGAENEIIAPMARVQDSGLLWLSTSQGGRRAQVRSALICSLLHLWPVHDGDTSVEGCHLLPQAQ